jgi:hypothetical protein
MDLFVQMCLGSPIHPQTRGPPSREPLSTASPITLQSKQATEASAGDPIHKELPSTIFWVLRNLASDWVIVMYEPIRKQEKENVSERNTGYRMIKEMTKFSSKLV